MNDEVSKIPKILRRIYSAVDELERLFPGRHFTPDGNMVGSLGEVWAAYAYGLKLLPPNAKNHDAKSAGGKLVQIKTTQRDSIPLRKAPAHLLAVKIHRNGTITEEFNGPGSTAWKLTRNRKPDTNGVYNIRLGKLRKLQEIVPGNQRIRRKKHGAGPDPT